MRAATAQVRYAFLNSFCLAVSAVLVIPCYALLTVCFGLLLSRLLQMGDVLTGVVQYLRPYGAFLDLGNGAVGLLHVSQISHERVVSVDKILREGDKLKVMVLSMDPQRGRVTLSTKKLEPTPGDMLRDPQLVFERAEEMAATFRRRVEAAEQNAYAQVDGSFAAEPAAASSAPGEF